MYITAHASTTSTASTTSPRSNPFSVPDIAGASNYLGYDGAGRPAYRSRPNDPVSAADRAALDHFEQRVMAADFPCVMARSIVNRHSLRMATYGSLGDPANAARLCHDLREFGLEFPASVQGAVSFVATFAEQAFDHETAFESALWRQLQAAHDLDARHFPWSDEVSSDPDSGEFSFSIGARAFFIVGMHSNASRLSRRMNAPTVVFNLHEQFVDLRESGKYAGIRDKIRARDLALQGSANPMSMDFGRRSEAAQYSGRVSPAEWKCPFARKAA
jgi:FPC/CPF motif-containing protein YcgG